LVQARSPVDFGIVIARSAMVLTTLESPTRAATAARAAAKHREPRALVLDEPSPCGTTRLATIVQRAPSTKDVLFQSPPRTILSARLATLSKRAELEDLAHQETCKNLAECSPRDVSLHRPTPRTSTGLGLIRKEDNRVELVEPDNPMDNLVDGKQTSSISSCMWSLEESFSGSLSGLSSLSRGERSVAVETPPNAPDAFGQSSELVQCHAPKRARTMAGVSRPSKLMNDGGRVMFF